MSYADLSGFDEVIKRNKKVMELLRLSAYSKKPFKLRPNKWYQWINPFWWRRAKQMEKLMVFLWKENKMDEKVRVFVEDALIYGSATMQAPFVKPDESVS